MIAPQTTPAFDEARYQSAIELARQIAEITGAHCGMAFSRIAGIDPNLLGLLGSPQGWTVIAAFVASDLGVIAPDLLPTVH